MAGRRRRRLRVVARVHRVARHCGRAAHPELARRLMLAVTDQFLAALRYGHAVTTIATLYPPTGSPVVLPVEDGADHDRPHRRPPPRARPHRRASLRRRHRGLPDPARRDPLNVYGGEIVVQHGIRYANEAMELVQLGVFRVESTRAASCRAAASRSPGGTGRASSSTRGSSCHASSPRRHATTLIQLLISEVYPSASFTITTGDTHDIPKHVVDRDRWPEIQRVAQVIGCEVFADADGDWVIQDVPDLATALPSRVAGRRWREWRPHLGYRYGHAGRARRT